MGLYVNGCISSYSVCHLHKTLLSTTVGTIPFCLHQHHLDLRPDLFLNPLTVLLLPPLKRIHPPPPCPASFSKTHPVHHFRDYHPHPEMFPRHFSPPFIH